MSDTTQVLLAALDEVQAGSKKLASLLAEERAKALSDEEVALRDQYISQLVTKMAAASLISKEDIPAVIEAYKNPVVLADGANQLLEHMTAGKQASQSVSMGRPSGHKSASSAVQSQVETRYRREIRA